MHLRVVSFRALRARPDAAPVGIPLERDGRDLDDVTQGQLPLELVIVRFTLRQAGQLRSGLRPASTSGAQDASRRGIAFGPPEGVGEGLPPLGRGISTANLELGTGTVQKPRHTAARCLQVQASLGVERRGRIPRAALSALRTRGAASLERNSPRNSHRAANRESAATGKSDAALSVAPPGLEPGLS